MKDVQRQNIARLQEREAKLDDLDERAGTFVRMYVQYMWICHVRTYVLMHVRTCAYTVFIREGLLICDIGRLEVMDSGY